MISITATTHAVVYGTFQSWSLEPDGAGIGREIKLVLRIEGDEMDGYHLCMSPEGFFTADSWFATLAEAKTAFSVSDAEWIGLLINGSGCLV